MIPSLFRTPLVLTALFFGLASLVFAPRAQAQALSATLVGDITDSSGAVLPRASVSALNVGTGTQAQVTANEEGQYSIASLPPGTYEVTVTARGFQTVRLRGIVANANATVRADARLQPGQVAETVEVSAEASALQTDSAVVRNEIRSTELQNVPVPVSRNYQNLLVTVPGISPPQDAHSISANPSRALQMNSNGTTAQSTAVRVDGATSWNSWLPHIAGYVPALESIEAVNVDSGSFEADLGFAGGAAVNVQIKSGTNEVHGSGFWYHNNQHMKARPYFLPANQEQNKRILNQFGGTVGGPIKKNKAFFFVSYEGTPDRQSSFRLANVPTALMRQGNFSQSPQPIYDPLSGTSIQTRTPFPNNIIPADRISPAARRIAELTPSPNVGAPGALGANYFANGAFAFDRHTVDTKFTFQPVEKLNLSARFSYLDWSFLNPPQFGELGGRGIENRGLYEGTGFGDTLSMTYSAIYTVSPTFVIDGYYGSTVINNSVDSIRMEENLGRDLLGIPGTNGTNREDGGWPGFVVQGFDAFGRANNNSPWSLKLPQAQYVANASWTLGKHDVKFGWNGLYMEIESMEPSGNPGFFNFNRGITGRAASAETPASVTNDYNAYAAFLLGMPSSIEKRVRTEPGTARNVSNSVYFGDRWRATSKLTLTTGLRWEYYGAPRRSGDRGLEIYDFNTNQLQLCGVGNLPQNCGFEMGKKYFAPRIGLAYRITDTFVMRAGYGITWDPINFARNAAVTYPVIATVTIPGANDYTPAGTLAAGILTIPPINLGNGVIDTPRTVALELSDPKFRRSYIQSWNMMLQKQIGSNWTAEAGYVATRQLHMQNRWNANYGFIGGGTAGLVLNQRFGRNAVTNFFSDAGGFRSYYDSLQSSLTKRFGQGYMVKVGYTWSKALGPVGNIIGVDGYANNTPAYWNLIRKAPMGYDRPHNFNVSFSSELPFGRGKAILSEGVGAAILGGWQLNALFTAYSGAPFTVTGDGASLNAPGNTQTADLIKPNVEMVGRRERWFDTSAYAPVTQARFGTGGHNQLRGPGMVNLDSSIYRAFRINERVGLQFRAELFNLTNTPHFANPSSNVSGANFGVITTVANTGREGIDERLFRVGLRMSF